MKKLMSSICAAAMLATFSISAPASAASIPSPLIAPTVQSPVQTVQRDWANDNNLRPRGGGERWSGRGNRDRWDGPRYRDRGRDYGWYRGHRGYRDYRPGYRRHNGYWFPSAAFITGAIVGGAIASQPSREYSRDYGSAHVNWCYDRYRSYRASDNTFQPYNGPRRQCRSPYY
ncbi:BA14K family protein [Aliihoeflea sp. PC F10.4]